MVNFNFPYVVFSVGSSALHKFIKRTRPDDDVDSYSDTELCMNK